MKIANIEDIMQLFIDFSGGADFDEFNHFEIDFNNQDDLISFFEKYIKPHFEKLNPVQIKDLQYSLSYFINEDSEIIQIKAENDLFPFDFPKDKKRFLKNLWIFLFGKLDYFLEEKPYKVIR